MRTLTGRAMKIATPVMRSPLTKTAGRCEVKTSNPKIKNIAICMSQAIVKAGEPIHTLDRTVAQQDSYQINREKPAASKGGSEPIRQHNERDGQHWIECGLFQLEATDKINRSPAKQQPKDGSDPHLLHKQQEHRKHRLMGVGEEVREANGEKNRHWVITARF